MLLQRAEGGVLGGGGNPTGLITTRGAGDLLTRTTWILFSAFLVISLSLTLIGGRERSSQAILNRLKTQSINPAGLADPARNSAVFAAGQHRARANRNGSAAQRPPRPRRRWDRLARRRRR